RIVARFHGVLGDSRGAVLARRRGALKLAGHARADLRRARQLRGAVEAEVVAQLHGLGIAELRASIDGLSLPGAAWLLSWTGGPPWWPGAAGFLRGRAQARRGGPTGALLVDLRRPGPVRRAGPPCSAQGRRAGALGDVRRRQPRAGGQVGPPHQPPRRSAGQGP